MAIVLGGISVPLDASDEMIRQAAAKKLDVAPDPRSAACA